MCRILGASLFRIYGAKCVTMAAHVLPYYLYSNTERYLNKIDAHTHVHIGLRHNFGQKLIIQPILKQGRHDEDTLYNYEGSRCLV